MARHTFPNLPFPRTFPNLNSSLKELLCLILLKMRGFLGCYWLEIFLFAGVRTFGTFEGWFIIYFGDVIVILSGFIVSIFFWLWVFFRVFWSVLAVWYPVFSGWKFLGDHPEAESSRSLKLDLGIKISLRLRLCFMRKVLLLIKIYQMQTDQ